MSLGKTFLPPGWHERLQMDRYPIKAFVRSRFIPLLKSGMKVLDAGSGRLPEQSLREDLLATGASLETLDFLPGEGVDHVADVAETRLPDASYDALLCLQVLEHVPEPWKVCRELYRIAKPGAVIVVSAPQSAWLHNMPYHYFHFTKVGMRKILEDAGLVVDVIEGQGGHFVNVGVNLHYSCRVWDELMEQKGNPIWYKMFRPFLRLWLGFVMKGFTLMMDKLLPWEDNTQGWNVLCHKP